MVDGEEWSGGAIPDTSWPLLEVEAKYVLSVRWPDVYGSSSEEIAVGKSSDCVAGRVEEPVDSVSEGPEDRVEWDIMVSVKDSVVVILLLVKTSVVTNDFVTETSPPESVALGPQDTDEVWYELVACSEQSGPLHICVLLDESSGSTDKLPPNTS